MADDREETSAHPPGSDEAILAELNERFDYATDQKSRIVEEGDIDVRYSAGHTFDEADLSARKGRLTVELDQLSQYTNQLVNSFRQNPRGAKVSPAGDGATDDTAELRANRLRQIEHDSHAQEVYTVAGENAVTRGYGYARIVTEYEEGASANQVLRLKAIPNPNQVVEDPDAESTSGADWSYLFFVHTVTTREFKRDYPDATVTDFAAAAAKAPKWFAKVGRVQIAEYWTVTETPAPGGIGRPTRTVCMYLTNGVELLTKPGHAKKTDWPGTSIPFAACYGKIVYQTDTTGDSQKMLQSYIRLGRDAAKAYNWTASTELEALALPVKAALFAYVGQLSPDDIALVERSTREPIALIQANATTEATGTQVLPLPQYGTRAPDISGYEIARESFRRDVQNALGRYSAQDARQGGTKVTSGAALRELDKSGDLGSYHFVAHYDDMIRELAVKLNELLKVYDDADKEVSTRLPDGTTTRVRINHPSIRDDKGNETYGPDDLRMDVGQHTITISTGPSFDSQREKGKDAAMTLLGNQQAFPYIAADSVRLMDLGPIGDQMAEDLEFLQPPAMQQARQQQKEGGQPDPKQLQQENGQLKERLQQLEQIAQQMDQEIKTKQAEQQAKTQIAQAEIQSKDQNAEADRQSTAAQAESEQQMKLEIAERELALKEAALALERDELAFKAEELQAKIAMQAAALESAETIARLNAQVKMDAAAKAARKMVVRKTIDRSPEGAILGSHEEHEDVGEPEGATQ